MNRTRLLTVVLAAALVVPALGQNPFDAPAQGGGNPFDGQPKQATTGGGQFQKLSPLVMKDTLFDNMDAFKMLVPEGWRVNGGVQWDLNKTHYAQLVLSMIGPGGEEVQFLPPKPYGYFEAEFFAPPQQPGMPPMPPIPQPDRPALGSIDGTGTTFAPLPQSTSDYVLQHYIPKNRPLARNVRIIEVQPLDAIRQQLEQTFGPMIQSGQQMAQQLNQMAQMSGGTHEENGGIIADAFRIQYEENGVTYTELLPVTGYWQQSLSTSMQAVLDQWGNMAQVPASRQLRQTWWISDGKSFRAPTQQWETAEPLMIAAAMSLEPLPKYATARMQLDKEIAESRRKIHEINMQGLRDRAKIMKETSDYIYEQNQAAYKARQESNDDMNEKITDLIARDIVHTETPDGDVKHPLNSNLYSDGDGNYGYLEDGLEPPPGWSRV